MPDAPGSPGIAGDGTVGDLAIVLHSHMPYVEGFGTYPFGEEWLFDAIVRSIPAGAGGCGPADDDRDARPRRPAGGRRC